MESRNKLRKILFAVGGTGGHLFPAQALARDLKEEDSSLEILFAGGKLGKNPFFNKLSFPFKEICSASPFYSNPGSAFFQIAYGFKEGIALLKEFTPDLILGFGSFYSFPVLAAARIKKIPYILVETNAYPGKVNRLFARNALFSAVQFTQASAHIKGKSCLAKIPIWAKESEMTMLSTLEARKYYQLEPDRFTLLVFGGSQGAKPINEAIGKLELKFPFQVLHLCGNEEDLEQLKKKYREQNIPHHVKPFEEQMHIAWRAADLAICRAGAATLTEMEAFEVPAILIPWPGAADRHQEKNGEVMEKLGGALILNQGQLRQLGEKIELAKSRLPQMKENLHKLRANEIPSLKNLLLNRGTK